MIESLVLENEQSYFPPNMSKKFFERYLSSTGSPFSSTLEWALLTSKLLLQPLPVQKFLQSLYCWRSDAPSVHFVSPSDTVGSRSHLLRIVYPWLPTRNQSVIVSVTHESYIGLQSSRYSLAIKLRQFAVSSPVLTILFPAWSKLSVQTKHCWSSFTG